MKKAVQLILFAPLGFFLAAACLASSSGGVLLQTGFDPAENPPYAVGPLAGQNGWFISGGSPAPAVQSSTVLDGTQAVQFNASGLTGRNLVTHILTDTLVENLVVFDFRFMQSTTGNSSVWDVLTVNGNAGFIQQLSVLDGVASFATGTAPAPRGVWNDFQLIVDFGSQTVTAFVNGVQIGTAQPSFSPSTRVTSVSFGINSSPGTDVGFFDSLSVSASQIEDAFQLRYLANLNAGDAFVNITNAGSLGSNSLGPLAGTSGRICVNVYAFTPDEAEIACCSCLVTPNALVSLSARRDLLPNPLGLSVPNSLIVKLLATVPLSASNTGGTQAGPFTGSTCNAASPFGAANFAPGLRAWATTVHALPTLPVTYGVSESAFQSAPLGAGELNKVTALCQFIVANGSGAGICRSCSLGGF